MINDIRTPILVCERTHFDINSLFATSSVLRLSQTVCTAVNPLLLPRRLLRSRSSFCAALPPALVPSVTERRSRKFSIASSAPAFNSCYLSLSDTSPLFSRQQQRRVVSATDSIRRYCVHALVRTTRPFDISRLSQCSWAMSLGLRGVVAAFVRGPLPLRSGGKAGAGAGAGAGTTRTLTAPAPPAAARPAARTAVTASTPVSCSSAAAAAAAAASSSSSSSSNSANNNNTSNSNSSSSSSSSSSSGPQSAPLHSPPSSSSTGLLAAASTVALLETPGVCARSEAPCPELSWRCGAVVTPHPEKADRGGEDAFFVAGNSLGVFDGVGGWASIGVDPGLYARQLARLTARALQTANGVSPEDALVHATENNEAIGSATACVLRLQDGHLSALNLGDSGFVVVRDGKVIEKTTEQQHYFNCPFQLGTDSMDNVSMGSRLSLALQHGDWLVIATDGLWDNVFLPEIVAMVAEHSKNAIDKERDSAKHGNTVKSLIHANPQALAESLAAYALKVALDERASSPFAVNAQSAGHLYLGGKLDDITVVAALVVDPSIEGVKAPAQTLSNAEIAEIITQVDEDVDAM